MKESVSNVLKQFRWWDWIILLFIAIIIVFCTVFFKPNAIIVLNTTFGVLTTLFLAKGFIIANYFGILHLIIYCFMCFSNRYFGEIFLCFAITLPAYILSIVTWHKNRLKKTGVVKVNKKITFKEFLIISLSLAVFSVGFYFILGALGTNQLLLSTFSVYLAFIYSYFSIRRSEINFIFRFLCDLISLGLWLAVFFENGTVHWIYAITLFSYFMYIFPDLYGIINWTKMKRVKDTDDIKQEIWNGLKNLD